MKLKEIEIVYVNTRDAWSMEQLRRKQGHTKDCAMVKFPLSLHSCTCNKKEEVK